MNANDTNENNKSEVHMYNYFGQPPISHFICYR